MIAKPALRAIVGALACVLCGAVAAQGRYEPHGGGGGPRGGFEGGGPRGGFEGGAPRGGFEGGAPRGGFGGGAPRGGFGGMEGRGGPAMRHEAPPFGYGSPYGLPPRYAPPPQPRGYESGPPRRPSEAPPGWRGAAREPPGVARGPDGSERPRMASLGWVIESIRRRSPGRQLDADVAYMDGRAVYRVRWLTEHGRRTDYIVDAETGAILSGR